MHDALVEKGQSLRDQLSNSSSSSSETKGGNAQATTTLSTMPVSDQTKKCTIQQIDAEMRREELELRAAFAALTR